MDHLDAAIADFEHAPLPATASGGAYVGIDPGLKGYTAFICPGPQTIIELVKTPVFGPADRPTGYDFRSMLAMARGWSSRGVELVFIEKQRGYKENGHQGNFMSGLGYGVWLTILHVADLSVEEMLPQQWKARMGILPPRTAPGELKRQVAGMSDEEAKRHKSRRRSKRSTYAKQKSREKATRLFPTADLYRTPRCKNPDDNLCEALLLAEMARRLRVGSA